MLQTAAPIAPDRTLLQRLQALQAANAVRTRHARLKRDVKAGRLPARQLLERPDRAPTMKVMDLLLATPKVGRVKADRMLRTARVSPSKSLAGMTQRQRDELATLLGRR